MSRLKILVVLAAFVIALCANTFTFAYYGREEKGKEQQNVIEPVWIHLSDQKESSNHNPDGTTVVYGMDVASSKTHSSNKDFGFWLVKMTKAKNEIELTYVRIAKDKTRYREVQKQVYYFDGTLKDAKILVVVPKLPEGFNKMKIYSGRSGFENWICLLDDRSTGLDPKDAKKLSMITYAYNIADRIYLKGITHVERTGPTSYTITGGNAYLYTFENKLLDERNGKRSCFIADKEANSAIDHIFEFYKERRKEKL